MLITLLGKKMMKKNFQFEVLNNKNIVAVKK